MTREPRHLDDVRLRRLEAERRDRRARQRRRLARLLVADVAAAGRVQALHAAARAR